MVEYPCFETPGVGALNEDLLVAGDGSAWNLEDFRFGGGGISAPL